MPSGQDPGSDPIISSFAADPEMAELVALFVRELPGRVRTLEAAWDDHRLRDVQRVAHQLRGAGSGYGFAGISRAAGSLEDRLAGLGQEDQSAACVMLDEYRALVDICRRACGSGADHPGR